MQEKLENVRSLKQIKVIFLLKKPKIQKDIKLYLYVISKSPSILSDSTQNLADKSTKNNIFVQKKCNVEQDNGM